MCQKQGEDIGPIGARCHSEGHRCPQGVCPVLFVEGVDSQNLLTEPGAMPL